MRKTFIDACVLIAAARGNDEVAEKAMSIIDDPERYFVSSDYIKLEVMPKCIYNAFKEEEEFYAAFFEAVSEWVDCNSEVVKLALTEGILHGLSAMDALHVASAFYAGTDEFVTAEKPEKPICRVDCIKVISIRK